MRALGTALSLTIFALIVLPPGYGALRLAGTSARGLAGLAAAFGAGWALVLPVVLLERWAHVPFLARCSPSDRSPGCGPVARRCARRAPWHPTSRSPWRWARSSMR